MKLLLLAGEESGLAYAREIAEGVRAVDDSAEIRGYSDYGFETADLAVFGFWEVIRRIFFFMRVERTMKKAIDEWRPDAVCTVDYPGMNLRLAAYAKKKGIKSVHVVCPQVWAWKSGRIPKIESSVDRLMCFFPFEPGLFKPGFAEFIGHPLAGKIRPGNAAGISGSETLAVLPGSRIGEIEKMLPVLLEALEELSFGEAVIPAANAKARAAIDRIVERFDRARIKVVDGGARDLLRRADCAVVASGTATLEAALARCPTLLVYRVGMLLGWFARMVVKGVRHVGLANIIAEKSGIPCPMPELLQEDFTLANVRRILGAWLADPDARRAESEKLDRTMELLGNGGDAMERVVRFLV